MAKRIHVFITFFLCTLASAFPLIVSMYYPYIETPFPKEDFVSGSFGSPGENHGDSHHEDDLSSFAQPIGDTGHTQEQAERITMSQFTGDLSKLNKLLFVNASASSELADAEYGNFPALLAIDGKTDTSWQEGAAGYGIDESITLYFADSTEVSVIEIFPGFSKSDYTFFSNGRPSRLKFDFSDSHSCTYDFEDTPGSVAIALSEPVTTDYVCITILGVYSAEWQDTAISEIRAYNINSPQ